MDIIVKFICNYWIIIFGVLAVIALVLTVEDDKFIDLNKIKGIMKK